MPDGEENERRREQQSQHVAKGRECERHFSSRLFVSADDAGSLATGSVLLLRLLPGFAATSSSVVLTLLVTLAPPPANC